MSDSAPAASTSSRLRSVEALQTRELQFVESLAAQWQATVAASPDSAATALLTSQLIPVLVPALSELGLRMEQEAGLHAAHEALRKTNPLVQPRPEFKPLTWLASYLLRNNPRYAKGGLSGGESGDPLLQHYSAKVQEAIAQSQR